MVEQGVVSDIGDGKLIVNIRRHPACGSCRACNMAEGRVMRLEFENTIGAQKGDVVNIELDDSVILKGAFLFYAAPLAGLMFGVFLGNILAKKAPLAMPAETISAAFGIISMIVTFMAVRQYSSAKRGRYKPRVSKA